MFLDSRKHRVSCLPVALVTSTPGKRMARLPAHWGLSFPNRDPEILREMLRDLPMIDRHNHMDLAPGRSPALIGLGHVCLVTKPTSDCLNGHIQTFIIAQAYYHCVLRCEPR